MESMNKIEAVLFDLDGTLLDSFPDFLASLENININSSSKKIDGSIVRANVSDGSSKLLKLVFDIDADDAVSYTHLRAHETGAYLVCRLLLEKKKKNK